MSSRIDSNIKLITAIGTPLTDDETLHADGLEAQINDQFAGGMTGLLVAGTMGLLQLLAEDTYRDLARRSAAVAAGRGEVLIGAGDASFARTRDRIDFLNSIDIDGVVVLSPYFITFSQAELQAYFTKLADRSRHKLFLYDLPGLTKTKIEIDTVLRLAEHPNIQGIKCSGELAGSRRLIDAVPDDFRVIVANPEMIDITLRGGVTEHLDGVFAMAPEWVQAIIDSGAAGDWAAAAAAQRKVIALLDVLRAHGIFQAFTAILNARGVGGHFTPAPMMRATSETTQAVRSSPIVQELIEQMKAR